MINRILSTHLLLTIICGAVLVVGSACKGAEPTSSARGGGDRGSSLPVKDVKLAPAEERTLTRKVAAPGTLAADEQATVSFKVAGRLSQLKVDLGSQVRKGQEIGQLETIEYRVRVEQSEAALQQARVRLGLPPQGTDDTITLENTATVRQARAVLDEARTSRDRIAQLVKDGVQAQAELDRVESAYKVADSRYQDAIEEVRNRQALLLQRRSELQIARQQLAETVLYAPFDGAVRERRSTIGEYLSAGMPVAVVVRLHPLRLRVELPERDARDMRAGQTVNVMVEGDTAIYTGRVVRLSPSFQEVSRTLVIEAEVDNRQGRLRPGSFAKAEIVTNSQSSVVMVPAEAIVTFAGIQKVYLTKDGKATEKNVVVGRREGDLVEIVEGLNAGENVVVSPGNLVSGQPVKVLN
jgi:RND family efflux transporter MFP subunit